jgi:hypothetical protein
MTAMIWPTLCNPFHGKAIALDINHQRAPLPLLFLVHEYMARGQKFLPTGDARHGGNRWLAEVDD